MNSQNLRLMLVAWPVALYLLAVLYLCGGRLPLGVYLFWGLFALLIPALGPFLLILARPGITMKVFNQNRQ